MTNETKHTPGPWTILPGEQGRLPRYIISADRLPPLKMICELGTKANARLIAAAPELLEALTHVLPLAEQAPGGGGYAIDTARAAIAKATGDK